MGRPRPKSALNPGFGPGSTPQGGGTPESRPARAHTDQVDPAVDRITTLVASAFAILECVRGEVEALQRRRDLPQYVTDRQLAESLQLPVETVRADCKRGVYKSAISRGRAGWRIPLDSVLEALAKHGEPASDTRRFNQDRFSDWKKVG